MDLEHLTKHQIVLLTLLVSFVTSIATGIVTVSLVNQAPPSVTRTINQIVEHTVEKVVPATQGATVVRGTPQTQTVTEKTVVVKDDDLAAQSIATMQKSLVRIVGKGSDMLISRGVMVGQGVAFADRDALLGSGYRQFEAILQDGKRYPVGLRAGAHGQALAVLDITAGTSSVGVPAPLADASKVQLGQTVIRISGGGADTVGTGVVASLPGTGGLIEASVSSATPGSVLMTIFGEVVGLTSGQSRQLGASFYTVPDRSLIAPSAS